MNTTRVSKRHGPARGPLEPLPCHRVQSDLWFSELPAELEQAKAFCRPCRLRTACLAGALERAEPCGVWGGEIFHRGTIIARKKPRGRPPGTKPVPGDPGGDHAPVYR